MNKRIASIVSYVLVLFLSCGFFIATLSFPPGEPGTGLYTSPAYYPQLLCILLGVFSLVGIYQDMYGAGRNETKRITIPNLRNYLLVIVMAVAAALIWQYGESFYAASFLCMAVLLYVLAEGPHSAKKALFSIAMAAGCTIFFYVSFAVLLNVQL